MIRIMIDSASDFTLAEAREKGMDFVSITVTLNENHYRDGVDATRDEMYEMLVGSKDFPKTTQPSPQDFLTIFEDARDKGDEIVYIGLSSALSGTVQSAHLAKSMAGYDSIHIVDTLNVASCIRILAEHALELRDGGMPAALIAEKLRALAPRVRIIAVLDTLEYLRRGGRLSAASAAIGTLANIKPVIHVDEEGKVGILAKCMGRVKAQKALMDCMEGRQIDIAFPFYTLYSHGTEACERLEEKLTAAGIAIDGRTQLGLTIGAHIGPGAAGVAFVEKV